ncbi:MAG: flagellar biosynthesis anti-sigma factor FlgM [Terracidiphilus sp.]|jgi:negative regulator of flagellin synthesis FlgM
MRVDLTQSAASQISNEPNTKNVSSRNSATTGLSGGEDRTTLSSDSSSVSSLVSTAMSSPEIREDKVSFLKQSIDSGQYKIDPNEIASSMIDEHA